MLFNGIVLVDGAELQNLTVQSGPTFPSSTNEGELFYRTDGASEALYVFNGEAWVRIFDQNNSISFTPVNRAGDTMTGVLTLSGNPVGSMDAATKSFVENYGHTFTSITGKPTTLAGYGITDAQPLDSDLTALAALSSTGIISRTGNGGAVIRTIIGGAGISVADGGGVSGNPTISLANAGTAGTYAQVSTDIYGRVVSGSTTLNWSQIVSQPTSLEGYGIAGGTLTGNLVLSADPSSNLQAATKQYVDAKATAVSSGSVASANKWTIARDLALTGDATATLSSVDGSTNVSTPITLSTVNSNVGSFGTASSVGTFVVNGKGLVTSASNTPIDISTAQVTSGTFADARIASSNVTQHQASLSITESQLVDGAIIARVAGNETISGTWSFSNAITGVDPTNATHLVTKQYVDNIATGLDLKASVRVATTSNIALTGSPTIDGVTVIVGDRVLVKDQATATQNGIYVVAAGAWSRAFDADNTPGQEISAGLYCFVEEGTVNADTGWVLITNGAIVLGATSLTFAQFTGLGQITAGNGLTKNGATISALSANAARIVISAGGIDLATVTDAGGGAFKKLITDGYGRVTGTSAVVLSDITTAMGYTPANIVSPDLTGIPTAPTASVGVNTTQIATTAFVTAAVNNAAAGSVASSNKWTTARNLSLTGDASATLVAVDGSTNVSTALTLATVNSNVGSFGSASAVPVLTVNGKGLVTAASTVAVVAPASTLTGTTLASNVISSSLTSVGTLGQLAVLSSGSTASVSVTDTGANGSNIRMVGNGVTTPTKTIRVFNGSFQIVNDAYATAILNLTDSGTLTLGGGVAATGFTGAIGSVTPNTGTFTVLTVNSRLSLNGLADCIVNGTAVTTTSTTTVDTFATATYRSAKYQAQISDGTSFETLEFLIIHDGTTVYMTTYGNVFTGAASLGAFDASIATGTLTVTYTAVAATNKTVKLFRTAVAV